MTNTTEAVPLPDHPQAHEMAWTSLEIKALRAYGAAREAAVRKELGADAMRYRWLRLQDWFDSDLCVLRDPKRVLTQSNGLGAYCPSRERLDEAIDTARAAAAANYGDRLYKEDPFKELRAYLQAWEGQSRETEDLLRKLEPHLDAIICYASTMGEHKPNKLVHAVRTLLTAAK